jgi:branched-chain amino acid transport system ATP-binding protein
VSKANAAVGLALLSVKNITAGYGASQVLFNISFDVLPGEIISLLGRNGMGKSTTIKCLAGLLTPTGGSIVFNGSNIERAPAYVVGRLGFGLVPEGRQVFPTLTVRENLVATANSRNVTDVNKTWTLERVQQLFPRLAERHKQLAGKLSGGEQQMLAIGRALMTNPKLLVLDEATEGLAPLIRQEIWNCLNTLKQEGQSMIVIDKNLKPLIALADRHYVYEKGQIVFTAMKTDLQDQQSAQFKQLQSYLHV